MDGSDRKPKRLRTLKASYKINLFTTVSEDVDLLDDLLETYKYYINLINKDCSKFTIFIKFIVRCCQAWSNFIRGGMKTIASTGFPRCWSLFGYLLPRETRVRVFDPRQQELLEDYILARRSYRTRWARRWLVFCFTFRTALMVLECFRAMAVDKMFWWVPWIVTAIRGFR